MTTMEGAPEGVLDFSRDARWPLADLLITQIFSKSLSRSNGVINRASFNINAIRHPTYNLLCTHQISYERGGSDQKRPEIGTF